MLGSVVHGRRKFDKLDVRAAAEQIGVSHTTLRGIEAGREPDLTTLRLVCRWLRITPSTFIDDMDGSAGPVALEVEVGPDDHLAPPASSELN